jgi:molecular chaperone DnaK (HSP70)
MGTNERLALLASAKIAGLDAAKVKIITDQAAVGTAYGIYKGSSLPAQDQPPKIVAFIDAGHSSIQVCLYSISDKIF